MKKKRIAFIFLCGLASGIFVAQGLFVLARRTGWNFGGEVMVIPLIFLLIHLGIMIGKMFPDKHTRREYYKDGYRVGFHHGLSKCLGSETNNTTEP